MKGTDNHINRIKHLVSIPMLLLNISTPRMKSQTTTVPIRRQPARDRHDRGCQTIDFQTLVGIETEKVREEERKYYEMQIKEVNKKIRCRVCHSMGRSYYSETLGS